MIRPHQHRSFRRGKRLRRCAVVLLVLAGVLGVAPTVSASAASARKHTVLTQHVQVNWAGTKKPKRTATAVVPGIGALTVICRPNATMVQLTASNHDAETQMWMAKYVNTGGHTSVAVKTVRLYRYANANDNGAGGTGSKGHEGLNSDRPIEGTSSGYMHGVISQRPGRNQPADTASLAPVTSFELTWYWSGFRRNPASKSCTIDVHLRTNLISSLGVNWHGNADAQNGTTRLFQIGGIGTLSIQCDADPNGTQAITLTPQSGHDVWLWAETIFSEGSVADHVDTEELPTDPVTGAVGPITLPPNGMLRLFYTAGSVRRDIIVSSYYVVNNADHPELNLCEVAAAAF